MTTWPRALWPGPQWKLRILAVSSDSEPSPPSLSQGRGGRGALRALREGFSGVAVHKIPGEARWTSLCVPAPCTLWGAWRWCPPCAVQQAPQLILMWCQARAKTPLNTNNHFNPPGVQPFLPVNGVHCQTHLHVCVVITIMIRTARTFEDVRVPSAVPGTPRVRRFVPCTNSEAQVPLPPWSFRRQSAEAETVTGSLEVAPPVRGGPRTPAQLDWNLSSSRGCPEAAGQAKAEERRGGWGGAFPTSPPLSALRPSTPWTLVLPSPPPGSGRLQGRRKESQLCSSRAGRSLNDRVTSVVPLTRPQDMHRACTRRCQVRASDGTTQSSYSPFPGCSFLRRSPQIPSDLGASLGAQLPAWRGLRFPNGRQIDCRRCYGVVKIK